MGSKRVLIFAGGNIDPQFIQHIKEDDLIIGADRGAFFLVEQGIKPHIAVGDFDSVTELELEHITKDSGQVISCDPINKNLTDTELAFETAMSHQATDIVMFGVIGTRFDHSISNIQMMLRGLQHQITSSIWDSHNYITLTGSSLIVEDRGYTYVSLIPLTPEVTGITLEGFVYPLDHATLKMGQSLAVSNKLESNRGTVQIESGLLLIIQSKD